MSDTLFFETFAKGKKEAKALKRSKDCVIYTRVSSQQQADNLSLATQLKACTLYAEKMEYNIAATFGGTYESAETDERKQFTAMISFVKKFKGKISYILVYSLERFSRNDNSIWLTNELRRLGIEIISVTQPIDTSNASGQMQQKMLFLFGEFDNQLRKQKCMAGIKEMLLKGDWPTKPPVGFDIIRENGKRKIVVNSKGRLIQQAFHWKANENLTAECIRERLAQKGFKIGRQQMSRVLRNPFYCGLMVHTMLEGKVVEGNHEQLISRDVFLRVNGLIKDNSHGYSINEENAAIPLKRFVSCGHCGQPLRGYIVKKKNIHYYKCNTKACNNNKSAKELNSFFEKILNAFKVDKAKDIIELIKRQTIAVFNQLTAGKHDDYQHLQREHTEIVKKINRLEERYIEEEIGGELYNKYRDRYNEEKVEIEKKLTKLSRQVSNLDESVGFVVKFALELPLKWARADYNTKQRIQFLLFPEGLSYNKKTDECRTTRINLLFLYLSYFQQIISNKKRGIPELGLDYSSFEHWVPRAGIEPALL
ncbi:recombinase family protein [Sphingobacterium daejeonense]|uniref:recombinase family protein n=1 Tax=Sphingobacterium daejeonense TaxID=371142 RepID=UPI0021A6F924|nr:recombinase family protein [Sphingobacterium daejeonense]MCT1531394.1 recombinase family protein [Sphingobacterium daejeonense]